MSFKVERELRDEFMEAAAAAHRPASQVIRELMRSFIDCSDAPGATEESLQAMREVEEGKTFKSTDVDDFRRQLGI